MANELEAGARLIDRLLKTGRVEVLWGGSNVKFVELRDRSSGLRASGRSYVSWHIALEQAAYEMTQLMAE